MLITPAKPEEFAAPPSPPATSKPPRLMSLDAYRGFIMLAMASAGLGIGQMVKKHPEEFGSGFWQMAAFQVEHVPWIGCSFWDLIQPSFMFMVGVAMPYSYAGRRQRGDSFSSQLTHVITRSVILVALGVFLSSNWDKQTNFAFMNVLSQIGLGYTFVFLLMNRSVKVQIGAIAAILIACWLLFVSYPAPPEGYDFTQAGMTAKEVDAGEFTLPGLSAHWDKNTNVGAEIDRWFLNLFPRKEPFQFNSGGYQTINFITSIATMLLGLMAGEMLRSDRTQFEKFRWLVLAGAICLALGLAAGSTVCPIIKRIWTPSWVLASGAATFWLLAAFYGVIDCIGFRWWSFPLVVVGTNSIVMYMMSQLLKGWTQQTLRTHLGYFGSEGWTVGAYHIDNPFAPAMWNGPYGPMIQLVATLTVFWLVCLWLYRQKIFVRI